MSLDCYNDILECPDLIDCLQISPRKSWEIHTLPPCENFHYHIFIAKMHVFRSSCRPIYIVFCDLLRVLSLFALCVVGSNARPYSCGLNLLLLLKKTQNLWIIIYGLKLPKVGMETKRYYQCCQICSQWQSCINASFTGLWCPCVCNRFTVCLLVNYFCHWKKVGPF